MNKKKVMICTLACAALLSLVGCASQTTGGNTGGNQPVVTYKPTVTINPTVRPTISPAATVRPTVEPVKTIKPTYSPKATWSPKPAQTNTPTTAKPARTVKPVQTSKPTQTTKPTTGERLPLDTTGNYSGLRLKRNSDRNDFVGYEIKNSKTNRVSSLTGSEPQVKIAVDAFNTFKKGHSNFVAYKFLEYHKFDSSEVAKLNKALKNETAVEYYRVTMEIYQYDKESYGSPYTDTSADPYYFRVTMYKNSNGEYKQYTYASMK